MKNIICILLTVCLSFVLLTACGVSGREGSIEGNASENLTVEENGTTLEDIAPGKEAMPEEDTVSEKETVPEGDTASEKDLAPEKEDIPEQDTVPGKEAVSEEGSGNSEEGIPSGKNDVTGETIKYVEQGMKISILGDSISTYRDWIPEVNSVFYPESGAVQDVSQTWWKIVMDGLQLELCSNGSSSMSACFGDSGSQDPLVGSSDLRISQLGGENGESPDIIIVYMGTNDMIESAPIGDNDGLHPVEEGYVDNFSDGYTLMLDKLEKSYPTAQIYCCTILPLGDWGTNQPFVPFVNGQGLTSEPYADQIRTIAGNRDIPVIDLYHCGITIDNMAQMTSDGVHPTPGGMQCIANMVMKCITE